MANLLSYTLKLQDLFSAPMRKAAAVGEQAMGKVTQAVAKVQSKAGGMGSAVSAATAKISAGSNRAVTSLTSLEIKLNTLTKERSISMNLRDIARTNRAIEDTERKMERLQNVGRRGSGGMGLGLLGGLALGAGAMGITSALQETAQVEGMKNSIAFSAGGGQKGAQANSFVKQTSDTLGLDFMGSMEGYKTLSGAMMGTKLEGAATQKIFRQLATATTVMGVDAENQKGAFLALGQMMSKGKVSAEELNGQLGERIPGAMGIAAKAMGMPAAKLMDLMKEGKVMSEDFLPKFAAELEKRFGPGLAKALDGIQPKINRFNNQWLDTKTTFITAVLPLITDTMGALTGLMKILQAGSHFVQEHSTAFKVLGTVLMPIVAGILAYTTYVRTAVIVTELWTAATALLNGTMALNPVGLVVAAVVALVAAVVYAWNKFEGFRGFLFGFGASVMQLFRGLGNVIAGAFTLDSAQISRGVQQLTQITQKYREGYAKGVADFRGKAPAGASPDQQLASSGTPKGSSAAGDVGLSNAKGKGGSATGAGRGITHITINVQQLGQTTIHATTVKESVGQMKESIRQALFEVLNDANAMTTAS
jgi:tape measure domain-containing protein